MKSIPIFFCNKFFLRWLFDLLLLISCPGNFLVLVLLRFPMLIFHVLAHKTQIACLTLECPFDTLFYICGGFSAYIIKNLILFHQ